MSITKYFLFNGRVPVLAVVCWAVVLIVEGACGPFIDAADPREVKVDPWDELMAA